MRANLLLLFVLFLAHPSAPAARPDLPISSALLKNTKSAHLNPPRSKPATPKDTIGAVRHTAASGVNQRVSSLNRDALIPDTLVPPPGHRSPPPPAAISGVDRHVRPRRVSIKVKVFFCSFCCRANTGGDEHVTPCIASSQPNIETIDKPISEIIDSLASLTEATGLTERIPYISPVAGLLRQALTMGNAVEQGANIKSHVLSDTLRKVAILVSDVGRMCQTNNLEVHDLPRGLDTVFRSLEIDLSRIEHAVRQSNGMGAIKETLFGPYVRWEVKKYGGRVLIELQAFQAVLAFDSRFMQLARRVVVEFNNVNTRYDKDQTPLHVVSQLGQVEMIRSLIKRGANLDAENEDKETPLFLVARNGNEDATKVLLESNAKVDHRNERGRTPLHEASERGHKAVVQSLLRVESQDATDAKNKYNWTALHLASRTGRREVVQVLLDSGADVNSTNDLGWTALHMASQKGHQDVVQLLLSKGADVDTQEERNEETALHMAEYYGHIAVAELLISGGANLHVQNKDGKTPLDIAMRKRPDYLGVRRS